MEIREIWGVSCDRIEAFFLAQEEVRKRGEGLFSFGACEICVTALPEREAGSLRFPRTELVFRGPEEETRTIYRRFYLRFLSAGA